MYDVCDRSEDGTGMISIFFFVKDTIYQTDIYLRDSKISVPPFSSSREEKLM